MYKRNTGSTTAVGWCVCLFHVWQAGGSGGRRGSGPKETPPPSRSDGAPISIKSQFSSRPAGPTEKFKPTYITGSFVIPALVSRERAKLFLSPPSLSVSRTSALCL